MKYFIFALIMLLIAFPVSSNSEDVIAGYIKYCTGLGATPSFCECRLNGLSSSLRKARAQKLKNLELFQTEEKKVLLADPALDERKLDAACDLYDSAMEYDAKASAVSPTDPPKIKNELIAKKLELLEEQNRLVESYNANHQSAGALIRGNYCADRLLMNQIKQDQVKDDGGLYPEVTRKYEEMNQKQFNRFATAGNRVQCAQ